ncbi:RNA polymerase [Sphingobacterium sp. ML3W]|uniref:RNA polymerase sigma factor n=1 Tax=Sphingobacterium sp. ML3W TaxID=1538644 RepID=UPI0004F88DF9|nr:sigma-70 family RNA polymerase sigma factor [Sphingobacterium sp. ML3W]AIM39077.1 RNA polymerase [Sphingobacterium sp. ML3W]
MIDFTSLSEEQLVLLLRNGDQHAFNEIYKRHWRGIFLVAKNRLGSEDDGYEIVQNIFLNLWRKGPFFELTKNFAVYFATATKYEVLKFIAKQGHLDHHRELILLEMSEHDNSTIDYLETKELMESLEQSVRLLPEKCQLVFRLRVEKEYSQKEIAKELDISEKTVEAHLSKARKHIRNDLNMMTILHLVCYFKFF